MSGSELSHCDYNQEAMNDLIAVTRLNGEQIGILAREVAVLNTQNKEMMRWMLLALLIIALGSKAVEMAQDIWGRDIPLVGRS